MMNHHKKNAFGVNKDLHRRRTAFRRKKKNSRNLSKYPLKIL